MKRSALMGSVRILQVTDLVVYNLLRMVDFFLLDV